MRAVALCLGILVGSCVAGCGSALQTQARAATVAAVATQGAARVVDDSAVQDARAACPRESAADMAACLAPVRARWAPADAAIASTRTALGAWIEALEVARIAGDGDDLWQPLAVAAARLVREYSALVDVLAAVGVALPDLPAFVLQASDVIGGE
jgi:hypothetical protein